MTDWLAEISAKARALPAERRGDLASSGTCQVLLLGDAGAEPVGLVLDVRSAGGGDGGSIQVREGVADGPDCVMEASAGDFGLLLRGEADPVEFFYGGRIRARGTIALGMQVASALLG